MNIKKLFYLCKNYNLKLIEDAAEAIGSHYKDKHPGTIGDLGVLSFNGNKIITTGGGGAILTQDEDLARQAKHLSTTAKQPHPWRYFHDNKGYNYRLPNINAALGCAQLEQLPKFLQNKRDLSAQYKKEFDACPGVKFFQEPEFAKSNYWLNVLLLDEEHSHHLESILKLCISEGLMVRPAWVLLNKLPMFESCPQAKLPVAESLVRRILNIPSSAVLGASNAQT